MSIIKHLQKFIEESDIDAILVYHPSNRRYLTGFTGSTGYVLLTLSDKIFFSDFRYVEQAEEECKDYEIKSIVDEKDVFIYLKENSICKLGVEKNFMSLNFAEDLIRQGNIQEILGIEDKLSEFRMIKDDEEIIKISRACEITDLAFEYIITQIYEGMTEHEINFKLQSFMRRFPEVESMAERFIVASGERGSLPHGLASSKKIKNGEFITIDFGCNCGGYWSDVTRTICLGKANTKQKAIYSTVLDAQKAAIEFIKAGISGREVDRIARDIIEKAGYGQYFGHGLGHSFGLDIHEAPRFAQNDQGDILLKDKMIMTVEPGIYIPGWGGVRIEDDIIVREDGFTNLTGASKELIEIY